MTGKIILVSSLLAALVLPWTTLGAWAARSSGPIVVQRLEFYSGVDCFKAGQHGKPTTSFGTSTDYINAVVVYRTWKGLHRVTFYFYAPRGKLNKKYTDAARDRGPTRDCAWVGIAGHSRAKRLGTWTVKIFIDGRQSLVGHFQLHLSHRL
jgi:hypothetical protein